MAARPASLKWFCKEICVMINRIAEAALLWFAPAIRQLMETVYGNWREQREARNCPPLKLPLKTKQKQELVVILIDKGQAFQSIEKFLVLGPLSSTYLDDPILLSLWQFGCFVFNKAKM